MNDENSFEGVSFVKVLVGLERFKLLKPREKEDFMVSLMRFVIHQEAKLYQTEKDLNLAKHDIELLRNSNGVA